MTRHSSRTARLAAALAGPIALIGLATGMASAAEPALRPVIEVDGAQVTLGDLFENAGANRTLPVMAAPAPGESTQLSLERAFEIANDAGLGWRPVADFDHAVITRAWRYLDESAVLRDLGDALKAESGAESLDLRPSGAPPRIMIARGALAPYRFENLRFDRNTGRYSATLVVDLDARTEQRVDLRGSAVSYERIAVLRHRLKPDDVVRDGDFAWTDMRADKLPADPVRDPSALIGRSPLRPIAPGKPLNHGDFGDAKIVAKGSLVTMHYDIGNLHLVATGRAQESGALDDSILVQNTDSHRIVDAVVIGAGRVTVRPGGVGLSRQTASN
jgi:flagella basal body P-ring formation protein FlgA